MSHSEHHESATALGSSLEPSPYTEEEWDSFRQDDLHAARCIAGLMVGIFLMGLFIYSIVAIWVINRAA
jgi:hypothetical protein